MARIYDLREQTMKFIITDKHTHGLWRITTTSGEFIRGDIPFKDKAQAIADEMNERRAGTGTFHVNSAFCRCNTCCD